jgi:hypothetical protein
MTAIHKGPISTRPIHANGSQLNRGVEHSPADDLAVVSPAMLQSVYSMMQNTNRMEGVLEWLR